MIPRSLFVLAILYGGLACISGVLGSKLVAIGPLVVEGGIFGFLLIVVLASAVTELHGKAVAQRLVLTAFLPLIASVLLFKLVVALPPASFWAPNQPKFAFVLDQSLRNMLAGMLAYGVSQMLNVTIFSALRGREGRGLLWLRSAVAGVASQAVDSVIFITAAFWGVQPIGAILPGQIVAKVVLSALLIPWLIYVVVGIGRRLDAPR